MMNKQKSKWGVLFLLVLVFIAPGIAAYVVFQHPNWLGSTTINKGKLLSPAVALNPLDDSKKWQIIYWSPTGCETGCMQQLDVLARMRLALGRKLYYVDQWLVMGDEVNSLTETAQALLKEQDFHIATLSTIQKEQMSALSTQPKVYLANPDHYLILSYDAQVNPDDIYKDLKHLLNNGNQSS